MIRRYFIPLFTGNSESAEDFYEFEHLRTFEYTVKHLNVLFFLLGSRNKASSRVRGFWVAEALENLGMTCRIVYGENRSSYLRCLIGLSKADILLIQKRYSRWDYYMLRLAAVMGKRIIFDIDDAYSNVENKTTLYNIVRIMKNASAVTVGSQNLLKFAKQYQINSHFVPTSIKLDNYGLTAEKEQKPDVCLGWIGNGAHYWRDLVEILYEPLKEIASQRKIRFKLVGACNQQELYQTFSNIPGLDISFIDEIDWTDPSVIFRKMRNFDIGLYPVLDNYSNQYKCGFKALEYMALGIPVVASPVGANCYIVNNGIDGYHAGCKQEWIEKLTRLISDSGTRRLMGLAGRQKVETQYSMTQYSKTLVEIMRVLCG